jgi:UDP-N-acetylmuramoyl-L-alanine--D-glutamate ligase
MGEKVMVAGLGKSGISAAKLLLEAGGEVLLYDGNEEIDIENILGNFKEEYLSKISFKLGSLSKSDLTGVNLCVISPGIDLMTPFVKVVYDSKIQIWSEIELGFAISKGNLVAITGTNGKTTTTALTGQIAKNYFDEVFTVGNIGLPYTDVALKTTENSVTVLEVSSFQLETIVDFKPHISAILNITPDHLDRHHNMEEYISIKKDITLNQTKEDFCILNYEDEVLRKFGESDKCPAKAIFFSSERKLEEGYYLFENAIYSKFNKEEKKILEVKELGILGKHNYENVMAAIAISVSLKIPMDIIVKTCKEFKGVEHRIEHVATKYGINYYNDSKGTNPDAAIKAVEAMPGPILLIAGGYDKKANYDEWVETFKGRVKYLVLIGQTRDAISECAKAHGFQDIMYAESLEEAVKVCASYADVGDYVLLSPACASWGMFKNYEQRGEVFKACVRKL